MTNKRILLILFLFGLLLRLYGSIQSYSSDINNHIAWGKEAVTTGFQGLYGKNFPKLYGQSYLNYPPIAVYLFSLSYLLYSLIGPLVWKLNLLIPAFPSIIVIIWRDQSFMLPAFIKLPAILSDLAIAYVIFLFAKKIIGERNSFIPYVATGLVLFNPAFFYNSSYWGQIEAIPIFFVITSLYLLLYTKHPIWSALLFTSALLAKQNAFVFIPLYVFVYLHKFGLKSFMQALLISILFFCFTFLPFVSKNNLFIFPFSTYIDKILFVSGSSFITDNAFNFWRLIVGESKVPDSHPFLFGISLAWYSYIIVVSLTALILILLHRSKYKNESVLAAATLIPFLTFIFFSRMHERHLEQALPFMLLIGLKNKVALALFIFISLFHFLNLYQKWLVNETIIQFLIVVVIATFIFLLIEYIRKTIYVRKND